MLAERQDAVKPMSAITNFQATCVGVNPLSLTALGLAKAQVNRPPGTLPFGWL
jgi:hypothetical protein